MDGLIAMISYGTSPTANTLLYHLVRANPERDSSGNSVPIWADHWFHDPKYGLFPPGEKLLGRMWKDERYVSTVLVCLSLAQYLKKHAVQKVYIHVAPQHQWRFMRDLRILCKILNVSTQIIISDAEQKLGARAFYWANSRHPQTTTALQWWKRELPIRAATLISWNYYARKSGLTAKDLVFSL
ncbi:MAG: hypothetical protein G01um101466_375 [Parcubacteria group bacterium Gr01-1014_66]|nr:MAG: hypothetical protein G01um101466_375 [Parcubacteria group bacterium Gr01-1014_66]